MRLLGVNEPVLPELLPMVGLPQGPPAAPTGDLWQHVLAVLDLLDEDASFPLALAALTVAFTTPAWAASGTAKGYFRLHQTRSTFTSACASLPTVTACTRPPPA